MHVVQKLIGHGGYSLDLRIPGEKERSNDVCSYIQTKYEDVVLALQGMQALFLVSRH